MATQEASFKATTMPSQADRKEVFYRHFQAECTDIQDLIAKLEDYSLAGGEKQDAIDHVLGAISRLSNEVADSFEFLPAYDQATYSRAIKALEEKLEETRIKLAPKKRFQFKNKSTTSAVSSNNAAESAPKESSASTNLGATSAESDSRDTIGDLPSFSKNYNEEMTRPALGSSLRKPSFSQATNVSITGHTGLHIILPSSASRATSSGSVTKLNGCIVDMSVPTTAGSGAPFAGLALKEINNSLIVAGHVAGAAHITAVENSILVVASRQVRMHECKNVDIYLHCASRPIIEDCSNIRFAPIPECYMTTTEEKVENHWDQIDDFKWLKVEHSPNWAILPENERLSEEIWTETVPGGPGVGLSDILKKVGIQK